MILFSPETSPITAYNLKKDFKKYGYFYKQTIGTTNVFIVSHPDDIKRILVTDWKKFGKIPQMRSNSLFETPSLFHLDPNDDWKRHRSLSSTAFSDGSLKFEFESNIDKITTDLINFWDKKAKNNETIDVCNDFGALTLDAIGISGFGREFKSIENQDDTYSKILSFLLKSTRIKSEIPKFIREYFPFPVFQRIKENDDKWKSFLNDVIDSRREELKRSEKEGFAFEKTDLLSKMMNSTESEENPFNQNELLANTHLFIGAGHETTANTLSWLFYFLAKYPKYQERIMEEAKMEFGNDRILSFDKLSKGFSFTKAVINETLRLKNPAFLIPRYSLEDVKIREYDVPKGSSILLAISVTGVNEEIWGNDALEFRPERFLEMDSTDLRYKFGPFSMGPRVCIGKRFAEMEMILIIAKAMMNFRVFPTNGFEDIREKIEFTMKPSKPIELHVEHLK